MELATHTVLDQMSSVAATRLTRTVDISQSLSRDDVSRTEGSADPGAIGPFLAWLQP